MPRMTRGRRPRARRCWIARLLNPSSASCRAETTPCCLDARPQAPPGNDWSIEHTLVCSSHQPCRTRPSADLADGDHAALMGADADRAVALGHLDVEAELAVFDHLA